MDRLVNTALTAMRGAMARQAAISNNLANVNTTGFRAEIANAETRWIKGDTFDTRAQASEQVIAADMAQGAVTETGNPLDVAMNGDAMLAVQAADGSEAYTRRGDLKVSDSGLLTTGDGMPVLGDGGPITLPQMDSVSIAKDGSIWGVPQGGDPANPQQVDKLKLVSPGRLQHSQGHGRPVSRSQWRRPSRRSARQRDRRIAGRIERQRHVGPRPDDRGEPRLGNPGQDDRHRQAARRRRRITDAAGLMTDLARLLLLMMR